MRIRSRHIIGIVFVLLGLFILYAIISQQGGDDEDFIDEIRRRQANTDISQGTGSLPPSGMSTEMAPKIAVDSQDIHLGTIPFDKEYVTSFPVYNKGKIPLVITDIQTTCTCTTGSMRDGDKTIPAGQKRDVKVMIYPDRIPFFHSKKRLTFLSNDPYQVGLNVNIEVDIEPELALSAEKVNMGVIQKGEEGKATIRLRQLLDTPLELEEIKEMAQDDSHVNDLLRGEFRKLPETEWQTPGKAEYEVDIFLAPETSPGEFRGSITLFTNLIRMDFMNFAVAAKVESFYTVKPALPTRLRLQYLEDEHVSGGTAVIKASQPFTIEDLRYDESKLNVTILPGEEENSLQVQVKSQGKLLTSELLEYVYFSVVSGDMRLPEKIGILGTKYTGHTRHDRPAL